MTIAILILGTLTLGQAKDEPGAIKGLPRSPSAIVVDWHTLILEGPQKTPLKVRLAGLSDPLPRTPVKGALRACRSRAAGELKALVKGSAVAYRVDPAFKGADGDLPYVHLYRAGDGVSVNRAMLATGWARIDLQVGVDPYPEMRAYQEAQDAAYKADSGIWSSSDDMQAIVAEEQKASREAKGIEMVRRYIPTPDPDIGEVVVIYDDELGGAPAASDQIALGQLIKATRAKDQVGREEMIKAGTLYFLDNNTDVRVLGRYLIDGFHVAEVRVQQGPYKDKTAWLPRGYLARVKMVPAKKR